ncbi:thiamine pyrophosphate-dependent enzyme, partial [uncultured Megasphaera sp.]|uniref:thiamine pyrophosphate-dependent enzyme n=1 Tax=uncultured Megasphaera sp. TaxID=165188 RepID=UPI002585F223
REAARPPGLAPSRFSRWARDSASTSSRSATGSKIIPYPSPSAPTKSKTTVYGNIDAPFDLCQLAQAAGATYVARSTVYHVQMLTDQTTKGLQHKGFSVIEAMSSCPTLFGRLNKLGGPAEMLQHFKDQSIMLAQARKLQPEEIAGKLVLGTFVNRTDRPEYAAQYEQLKKAAERQADV